MWYMQHENKTAWQTNQSLQHDTYITFTYNYRFEKKPIKLTAEDPGKTKYVEYEEAEGSVAELISVPWIYCQIWWSMQLTKRGFH